MPGGTFWKALSGQRAKKLAKALLLTARGLDIGSSEGPADSRRQKQRVFHMQ